ncbi:hypothetical protein J2Y45_006823 [Dyadobacter sp. BE34]|jgi:hypothetical protein|uniref:TonB C-terminal domain-containing protein n=1 Tax=Dyadobacter fermentans TaxID=94254 RepID=A0ABU1R8F7_9BACT|nr:MULTISPECIES: hypothetical protein [Dyadobacter]HEV7382055.1 hypothetical protein [Dyadobacter sp.]MDR6809689.1 hypothetical protein [Dyadobacter fermentans]MDR7047489.1 hypothetical protein [Dyadobacter sp. BE242]MDR7201659.1 hypothetical protein [Dyadobacter sp. BE34]MDR7219529.1 hypothetical protein [Dyadobacter sp. BE31]
MKGLMVLFLLFFTTVATCYSLTRWEKPYEIGNQLSCLLDYPAVLGENGGIVVIQFSVGEDSAIGKVKVFTRDDKLNYDLIRQLTGKRIFLPDHHPAASYIVRLRFVRAK